MRVLDIRTFPGPNVHSHRPMLVMRLDLEALDERESREFAGFNERLLTLLPGLYEHYCGLGHPGGFVERLKGGTYFGHIVEHVALELSEPAGIGVTRGKTRATDAPGVYTVAVAYCAEAGMRFLLRTAVDLVEALLRGEPFDVEASVAEARRIVAATELGPSTRAIVAAAERRGIPWKRIGDGSLVRLGYGKNRVFIQAAMSGRTSAVAVEIAGDKELTKALLDAANLPVPRGRIVANEAEARQALAELGAPIVIKPLDGRQGRGVSVNVRTEAACDEAFRIAAEFSGSVLAEEQIAGRNYRVLVVNGSAVAASERLPAHVVGNGAQTVAELIAAANRDPRRGEGHDAPLTRLELDGEALAQLDRQGYSLSDVPHGGDAVYLRESANLSTGGTARDVTAVAHPSVLRLCERAARVIGLDICGVDLMLQDITRPFTPGSGAIIELNAAPGLRMHVHPSEGAARDVGEAIVDALYPPGSSSRIPLIAVTGTNGKTTTARMIAAIWREAGATVGLTTTDGIEIGGERIVSGDCAGPRSAESVLADPAVDVAVLETARGGIVRYGLGYDWADVAVVTNIQPDHIGQDGIKTLQDLVRIKGLVAERVRRGGTLVLNADDPQAASLAQNRYVREGGVHMVFYTLDPQQPPVRDHLARGGTVFAVRDGLIVELTARECRPLLTVAEIPVTLGGLAQYHTDNALAAIAASRAAGVAAKTIVAGMRGFHESAGRTNRYRAGPGYLLVDYGHNAHAFAAVAQLAARWRAGRVTAVVSVPGDRADALIVEAGRTLAAGFDRIVVREDDDRRGRRPGEVAGLLCQAIGEVAPERECTTVLDERAALRHAVATMEPGELVVLFYDEMHGIEAVLRQVGARPLPAGSPFGTAPSERQSPAHRRTGRRQLASSRRR